MKRLAVVLAAGLVAGAAGLVSAPAQAQVFVDGVVRVQSPNWDHPRYQRWQGERRWGGGHGYGYGYDHGWRGERRWHGGGGWGPRCRTVMTTRYSYRWGGYVQRPVEVCG